MRLPVRLPVCRGALGPTNHRWLLHDLEHSAPSSNECLSSTQNHCAAFLDNWNVWMDGSRAPTSFTRTCLRTRPDDGRPHTFAKSWAERRRHVRTPAEQVSRLLLQATVVDDPGAVDIPHVRMDGALKRERSASPTPGTT